MVPNVRRSKHRKRGNSMSREAYAREKFGVAVAGMATGPTSIQDRLLTAYMSLHPVQAGDFTRPDDAALYRSIIARLTSVKDGPGDEGYVKNTLAVMSDDMAESIADDIVAINDSIRRSD